jgi:hypothetical protein
VVETGLGVLLDLLEVAIGIRPADDLLGNVLLAHHLGGVLEMSRQRQLL